MTTGVWVLGDQLHPGQAALADQDRSRVRVLLIESAAWPSGRPVHVQKLVLVWSAMRHFAAELRLAGWSVDHLEVEDFGEALRSWIAREGIRELRLMEPADRPFRRMVEALALPVTLVWVPSNAFLWSRSAFAAWASGRRQLRMETFYREGRRRFGVLMAEGGEQPLGDRWNYDQENRRPPGRGLVGPEPLWFEPDAITGAVIAKVAALGERRLAAGASPLPGNLEPFRWGVTRAQAHAVLEHFIDTRLERFGPHQDAMVSGQPTLWHALLSPYLNLGLLHPLEVIRRVEAEGRARRTPLASLEGFLRQVLGWREYTHGLHHWFGEDYGASNHFDHHEPLPAFFERLGGSGMACLDDTFAAIRELAYAHHIQRLMLLANYGLIAGLEPAALTSWFRRVFIDGFDWVMETNVLGMGLFADGGRLASKPYAASGSYINRMGTYCKGCRFDPKQRTGEHACPFNTLYWDFLDRHRGSLGANPRMALVMKQLEKFPEGELEAIRSTAAAHRACVAGGV
ncbi:MAG: deoxyribodipyrimidine photolyase [Cyanobium sp. CACIAM 14]|nr:MAG: deoxyribodipyrimidine photolyase [Cyanobium sp. CACIAM 14]